MEQEDFIEIASKVGKTVEDLQVEFDKYKVQTSDKYKGRLTGDTLDARVQSLFKQKYRAELVAMDNSPAKPYQIMIFGISDIKDKLYFPRKEAIELYKANPNKYVMEGLINEYTEVDDGILKRFKSYVDGELKEEMVKKVSATAVEYGEEGSGIWLAPVDINQFGFGDKANPGYGLEYPLHKYSRYVYGVAEPQDGGDVKWTKIMLRGDTATQDMPIINNSYMVRVLNFSKDTDEEYNLMNMPKQAAFVPIKWNPFGDELFIESVLELEFMQKKSMLLGEVEDFLNKTEQAKTNKTYTKWNDAIIVEADIMEMYPNLDPAKDWSDKIVVDDESLTVDFNLDKVQSNISTYIAKANVIDFGIDSRVILTCFPKWIKKENELPRLTLTTFGVYALDELKTDYNIEDFKKDDL